MSTEDILVNRRSIRVYENKDVPEALLDHLLDVSAHTSTCGNMQLYSVVVTRDNNIKQKLSPAHFSQPAFVNAPVILTFCADYNRFDKWCEINDAVPGYGNVESFVSAAVDTIALAQSFSLLAEENGLGICYLGTTTYNPKEIAQVLRLPKMVFPLVTLSVGYPAEKPSQTDRIPSEGWIHQETYKDYTKDAIDHLYGYKDKIPENLAFVKENGKKTLAQVFTDIRYTKADGDVFSEKFVEFLKEQGFLGEM